MDAAGDATPARVQVKNADGMLRWESIPRVHIAKYGAYMDEDSSHNPDHEVDNLARVQRGLEQERSTDAGASPLHGVVFEGTSPYGTGSGSQDTALAIAAFSGMPVVRVGRADPGGPVESQPESVGHCRQQSGHEQGEAAAHGRHAEVGQAAQGLRP